MLGTGIPWASGQLSGDELITSSLVKGFFHGGIVWGGRGRLAGASPLLRRRGGPYRPLRCAHGENEEDRRRVA